jgi:sirohydrochlorin cobaltochelatase
MPSRAGARTVEPEPDGLRTLLLAPVEPEAAAPLERLATRLSAAVGHAVEPVRLEGLGESLTAALSRARVDGVTRLALLPLGLDAEAALRVGAAATRLAAGGPALAVALPPDPGDLARILGDRARQALGRLPGGPMAPGDVVVVLAGGGANPGANAELAKLARLVYEAHRFADVGYAFLDVTAPTVAEAIARWATLGARRLVVVPHLLFAGPALRRLRRTAAAAATSAGVEVAVAGPLAPHPALVRALARRHVEALLGPAVVGELGHAHGPVSLAELEARMATLLPPRYRDPGATVSSEPMGAAPLLRDAEGGVAWDTMWQGFCELALAGGPPHRGTLLEPVTRDEALGDPERDLAVRREIARGVRLTTGLATVDGPPGWIGVACESAEMAIWLVRAIVVENVMARREGRTLYLPVGPRFTLDGEIKSIVTAVAKTYHYWTQHAAAAALEASTGIPPAPGCPPGA